MNKYEKNLNKILKLSYIDELKNLWLVSEKPTYKKIYFFFKKTFFSLSKIFFCLINFFNLKKTSKIEYSKYKWIIVNDHTGHCENIIDGIIEKFSKKNSILYISLKSNLGENKFKVARKINKFEKINFITFIKAVKFTLITEKKFKNYGLWRVPVFLTNIIKAAIAIEAINFYKKIKFSNRCKLITLCDAHWHQNILSSEFKKRKLKSFTLIHGQPTIWSNITPFNSDYILSWGPKMTKKIFKNNKKIKKENIIEIGNTAHSEYKNIYNIYNYKFNDINEIIFISPGTINKVYGKQDLEKFLIKIKNFSLLDFKISFRPRPYGDEKEFVKNFVLKNNLSKKITIYDNINFDSLVNKNRIFIGSVSSAIFEVFMLNGLFIGLNDELPQNYLKSQITYSSDLYFDIKNLENFIINLKKKDMFKKYLKELFIVKKGLSSSIPDRIDTYLEKTIEQKNKIFYQKQKISTN